MEGGGMEVDPQGGGTDPQGGGTGPQGGGTDPRGGGTDPQGGGTDPQGGGTDHQGGGTDPQDGGTDPQDGGTDPQGRLGVRREGNTVLVPGIAHPHRFQLADMANSLRWGEQPPAGAPPSVPYLRIPPPAERNGLTRRQWLLQQTGGQRTVGHGQRRGQGRGRGGGGPPRGGGGGPSRGGGRGRSVVVIKHANNIYL
jgi:hypothetical protein